MTHRAPRLLVVASALVLVGAVAALAWYLLGEERRAGRFVASLLAERTGLPITVERASLEPSRIRLYGVRVQAGRGSPVEVRVREVDVAGGMLSLVAPAGRHLSVVAVAASVAVPPGGAPPSGDTLDAVRRALRALLDWPALLSFRLDGGRLESGGRAYRLELTADTVPAGVTLAIVLTPPSEPAVLRLDARGLPVGDADLRLGLDVTAAPRRLAPLWPSGIPAPAALALKGDVTLERAGRSLADGRLTVGEPASPAVVDFTARYEGAAPVLVVPRYALQSRPGLRLEGDGELRAVAGGARARITARGSVDGSRVDGSATWELGGSRPFGGELTMADVDGPRVARRVGLEAPAAVNAGTLRARFSGESGGRQPRASLEVTLGGVTTAELPELVTDATLAAELRLAVGEPRLTTIESSTLTLTRGGRHLGVVTAASRPGGLWPIAIAARVDDLAVLGPVLPLAPTLAGSARLTGELSHLQTPAFRGVLEADIVAARVALGTPATVSGARAAIPVTWGLPPAERPGSVSAVRLTAWGLVLEHLTSTAWLTDGQLLLPDIRYVHYGGHGSGWLEARPDDRPALLRMRLEGQDVDLQRLSREAGANVGRITGSARYVANAQYARADGFVAAARMDSEGDGGEVSLDAIQRLLDSAAVQVDGNAVLQQTLQNLRTFRYDTLESEVRYSGGSGRLDVSLRGKKRLGIFPAPVEAINIHNVPLAVLARAFAKERTP